MGYSPLGGKESDMTKRFHFLSLSLNLYFASCNPHFTFGQAAWWAAVCGVAQSQTQLKQLSSSSKLRITSDNSFSATILEFLIAQSCFLLHDDF